jgi:predicted ATPase
MAPEQLDGAGLSPATDWYAVGVMLYVALTGELPFGGDILDIAFAKRTPEGPTLVGEAIPDDLRALCLALLKPDATARPTIREIRSSLGLSASAERVEEVFVGRKTELERLRSAFARSRTQTQALIVSGEPGIGKSALVERFLAGLGNQAIVLRGRCYEQESVPFGGVDSLIDALSDYLLGLSNDDLAVLFAGGDSHVARVFPVLYRIPLLAARRVDGPMVSDAMLRDLAIRELAQIFTALGRLQTPVVYLDDLQWVDPDSLTLIREAFLGKRARCLFVATMRSSGEAAPELASFVEGLERVEIGRLSGEEALHVCDSLPTLAADLRERVLLEASGHPMFLAELLRSARTGTWVHDGRVRLQDVLYRRIAARDDVERAFLEVTALAGTPTPYGVLAQAAGLDVGECRSRLAALRAAQLVRISKVDGDRCVEPYHDRVREALLERLGLGEGGPLARLHLRLGRALLAATPDDSLGSRIFSVVHHMNSGRSHIETSGDKRRLAELNLLASKKALAVTAFDRARLYAETGLECLQEASGDAEAWSREPTLCRELYLARMVGQYRSGHRERALQTFDHAKRHVRDPVDRTDLYVTLIDLEGPNSFTNAIEAGREILADLGAPLPRRTTKLHVLGEYARTRWSQRGRRPEELRHSPALRDPRTHSALRVLLAVSAPTYIAGDTNLFAWNVLRQARLSFERGLGEMSPTAFVSYGTILAVAFGKHQEGAAFGRLAIELADQDKHPRIIGATHCGNAMLIQPWVMGFARSFELVEKARELSHAYADTVYEGFSLVTAAFLSVAMGRDIEETQRCVERAGEFGSACKMDVQTEAMEAYGRYVLALRGQTSSLADVSLPGSDQATFLASLGEYHGRVWMDLILAELSYLAEDLPRAEAHLRAFQRRSSSVHGTPATADIWLLSALIAAQGFESASVAGRVERVVQVARAAHKLGAWARNCPETFEPHARLARAELARIRGRVAKTAEAYERAIAVARRYDAPKREAIACELASRHARARGIRTDAERYRSMAIEAYRRWGATAKARMLEGMRLA